MPIWDGRISPVLDVAGRFLVVHFEEDREIGRREFLVGLSKTSSLARCIKEIGADAILCAAVSLPLACALDRSGVSVFSHICGEIENVIQGFLQNTLDQPEFRMPGCCQSLCGCHQNRRHRRSNVWHTQNDRKT